MFSIIQTEPIVNCRNRLPQQPRAGYSAILFMFFLEVNFGKDEVGGSNPPSSSTKTALFSRKGRFYFIFHDFLACLEFWIRALTTEQATDRKNQCSGGIEPPEHCAFQPVFAFLAAISCFISWISWASFSSHSSYVLAYTFRAMRFPLTTGEYRPSQRFSLIWLTQPVPGLRRWPL